MAEPMRVEVGVAALVFNGGRLLMLRRAGSHGAGMWSIPGGKPEYGESADGQTPERTAERETLEETGVIVEAVQRLAYTDDFMPGWQRHFFTHYLLCRYLDGTPEVVEPDKCLDVTWMPLEEVKRLRPLFPPFAHFLEDNPGILEQLAAEAL